MQKRHAYDPGREAGQGKGTSGERGLLFTLLGTSLQRTQGVYCTLRAWCNSSPDRLCGLEKHGKKVAACKSKACRPPTPRRPTLHLHCTGALADETHPQRLTASATCHVPSVGQAARRKGQQICRRQPSAHRPTSSVRSEICWPANETLRVHDVRVRQARRSH